MTHVNFTNALFLIRQTCPHHVTATSRRPPTQPTLVTLLHSCPTCASRLSIVARISWSLTLEVRWQRSLMGGYHWKRLSSCYCMILTTPSPVTDTQNNRFARWQRSFRLYSLGRTGLRSYICQGKKTNSEYFDTYKAKCGVHTPVSNAQSCSLLCLRSTVSLHGHLCRGF